MSDNIATMTAEELRRHIKSLDENHRLRMNALRALQRAKLAQEKAKQEQQ